MSSALHGERQWTDLLVCRDESPDKISIRIHIDELNVAHDQLAVRFRLGQAGLHSLILRDRLLLAVDVLKGVDEPVQGVDCEFAKD